jgi:GNAT superfamily N-acetyltransferase
VTLAGITLREQMNGVDWAALKAVLHADDFDNGRTPAQLAASFHNSLAVIAYVDDQIIGTARALSDGVCNAYIVDVWTYTPYRRRGVARAMLERLLARLRGQHVFLWTDDAVAFYAQLGFERSPAVGMEMVSGTWLVNDAP